MIGYVTLGTNDLKKAAAFYDKIAAEMGIGRFMESDTFIAWGSDDGSAGLGLTQPFDGKPMTVGNGVMVALAAKDKAEVDRIYKLALSLGGTDEGPPGQRGEGFLRRLFQGPGRQQAQRLRDGLMYPLCEAAPTFASPLVGEVGSHRQMRSG